MDMDSLPTHIYILQRYDEKYIYISLQKYDKKYRFVFDMCNIRSIVDTY